MHVRIIRPSGLGLKIIDRSPSGKFARIFNDTHTKKKFILNLVHSCYVLRVRPTWSSFLSLSIHTHTLILTYIHAYSYTCMVGVYVCVLFTSTKKTKVYEAGPMDKSGITTLVGFNLRKWKREREQNLHTRTGYILLLCLTFYSFVHAVTGPIYYGHNNHWCPYSFFSFFFFDAPRIPEYSIALVGMKNRSIRYIVAT